MTALPFKQSRAVEVFYLALPGRNHLLPATSNPYRDVIACGIT